MQIDFTISCNSTRISLKKQIYSDLDPFGLGRARTTAVGPMHPLLKGDKFMKHPQVMFLGLLGPEENKGRFFRSASDGEGQALALR